MEEDDKAKQFIYRIFISYQKKRNLWDILIHLKKESFRIGSKTS